MTKYALLKYKTENVGDEIQSIAARRFLPQVDYYINRDEIGDWQNGHPGEDVKLITNGWWMKSPFAWPPSDKSLKPLLISMYIEPNPVDGSGSSVTPSELFLTDQSKKYLTLRGPVGARDKFTMGFLKENNIPAYFSGCITLTLQKDVSIQKRDFILAVDVSDQLYNFMTSRTKRPVIRLSPYGDFDLSDRGRFAVAEYFLYLYQSAHSIVTARLHAMLPSLALKTPVLLVKDDANYDSNRYAGLDELARSATEQQYMNCYDLFDLDNPGDNPTKYLKLRRNLIKQCAEFTGFDNDQTFLSKPINELLTSDELIETFADSFIKRHKLLDSQLYSDWLEDERRKDQQIIDELKQKNKANEVLLRDYDKIKRSSLRYRARMIKARLRGCG